MQRYWLIGFAICGLTSLGGQDGHKLFAQDPAPGPVSAETAAAATAPQEQMIYLPYEELQAVFQKHGAAVFLPFQDYLKLWEKTWGSSTRPPDQPPVGGVISNAKYTAKVEKDVVRIRAVFAVQVLKEGWVEIPIAFGEAAIGTVTGDPGPVLLRGTGNGTYALLFSKSGQHSVTMDLTARVRTAPEGRSFDLQIPNVGITDFELTVPDSDQSIELQPKLLQETVPGDAKVTQLRASLGSTDKVTARWHPRVGTKPDMELLASATNATLISVEDGLIHADAHFQIEVLRGQIEKLRIAVPKGQRILDVTSEARIKEWSVVEEEGRQVITAELLSRQSGKVPLEVHTEWALTPDPFDAAGLADGTAYGIHLLDVLRESGQVAMRTGSDLVLNVTTQQGLARIDEGEVDQRIKRPGASYFKYYSPQCRLSATAKPVQPRVVVDHYADVVMTTDQLRLQTVLNYTIERAGLFELKLGKPTDMTVENVSCDGLKQYDVSADGGTLTVVLRESRQGSLSVNVTLTRPRDAQAQTEDFTAPLLEPQGVEVETGHLRMIAPPSIEVITDTTGIVGYQPDPAPNVSVSGTQRLVSAWTFNRRPLNLPAKTLQKPTRLTASVATTVDVEQGQVQVATLVSFLVEFAGLDTFRISVPEAIADTVQIQAADGCPAPIRQKSKGDAVDGFVPWTIVLQREVTGIVPLRVTYDLKPAVGENANTETSTVSLIRVLDPFVGTDDAPAQRSISVARITGEATVRKDRVLSVSAKASGGDVETIDVRELTQLAADGFVAFRYYEQPVEVSLTASKYDVQKVVETVVSRGLVEVVFDRSGIALVRGRYQTKSSERQRLRIDLPIGIEPLGAELDGQSVALEKNPDAKPSDGWEAYYVNVARTKGSDEQFLFAVQYRLKLTPPPFQSQRGYLMTRMPVLGGTDASVPVQQFRVVLWAPDEYAFVETPEHYESLRRPTWRELLWGGHGSAGFDGGSWIGGSGGGVFDFPTEGHAYVYTNLGGRDRIVVQWWHLPWFTWIVSGSLVIIGVALLWTSWENKLTLLIIAAFAASAYALKDPELVMHTVAVAMYGLIAMVAIWIVHGLFQFGRGLKPRRSNGTPPSPPAAAVIPPPGVFDSVTLGMQKS